MILNINSPSDSISRFSLALCSIILVLYTPVNDTDQIESITAKNNSPLINGLRLLILGDSNDRYIAEEWCLVSTRIEASEKRDTKICVEPSLNISVAMMRYATFPLISYSVDWSNNSEKITSTFDEFFLSTLRDSTTLLGGPPNAVLMQSLFHDLAYTYSLSPQLVHGMAASDVMWFEWLAHWSTVVEASVSACTQRFGENTWIGWRNSNLVLQGDHDGWLLLAPRIQSANAEAAKMSQRSGIRLIDFQSFSRLEDLSDYVHPKRFVHNAFMNELMKNLTTLSV
jgi:hypothetical protein